MSEDSPGQGAFTKAQEYGVERYPAMVRDLLIGLRMVQKAGVKSALAHARSAALRRAHHLLVDKHLHARLPSTDFGEIALQGLALHTSASYEASAAFNSGITPSKTLHWTMAALGLDVARYHFVDIGSGWGSIVLLAADYSFRSVTGVEFAEELHRKACANLEWARANGLATRSTVELRNESALETELPGGPIVMFMFNPFGEPVMRPFLERIDASVRDNPRAIILIYVNPAEAHLLARPGVSELALKGPKAWLLKLFGPYRVRVYCWDRLSKRAARNCVTPR
jgi:hypothetical protein